MKNKIPQIVEHVIIGIAIGVTITHYLIVKPLQRQVRKAQQDLAQSIKQTEQVLAENEKLQKAIDDYLKNLHSTTIYHQ